MLQPPNPTDLITHFPLLHRLYFVGSTVVIYQLQGSETFFQPEPPANLTFTFSDKDLWLIPEPFFPFFYCSFIPN